MGLIMPPAVAFLSYVSRSHFISRHHSYAERSGLLSSSGLPMRDAIVIQLLRVFILEFCSRTSTSSPVSPRRDLRPKTAPNNKRTIPVLTSMSGEITAADAATR